MAAIVSLEELAGYVASGNRIGIGGVHFSRLPLSLLREVLHRQLTDFTFIGWGGGLALELMLEAKAVTKLIFCFSSLDVFGLAPRFRGALEKNEIEVEEWTALAMIQGLQAARMNLPGLPMQYPAGSDLTKSGSFWIKENSPFTGEPILWVRRLDIDALLLHVQRADTEGNVEIQGARGLDLSLIGASKKVLVSAEEIVKVGQLGASNAFLLPADFVTAVARVPYGAHPTSCLPHYATDYRALLQYSQEGILPKAPDEKSKGFLVSAAAVSPQCFAAAMRKHRAATKRDTRNSARYSVDELMAVCLSREYDNESICSVGSVSPLAGISYLLAKHTHAPKMEIIAFNGGFIDVDSHPMSLSLAEPLECKGSKVHWGGDETYRWYYQSGKITHEVVTVAQIDLHGSTNNAWINLPGKRVRLPGQGGMADVANLHQHFLLYLTRQSPERFVERVEFSTAGRQLLTEEVRRRAGLRPGKVRLVSNLGIFELDEMAGRFRLMSIHPGVTLEEIRAQTGGEFLLADPLPVTEAPSEEELHLIRDEIDPFEIRKLEFVPAKERNQLIERILNAEAQLLEEMHAN